MWGYIESWSNNIGENLGRDQTAEDKDKLSFGKLKYIWVSAISSSMADITLVLAMVGGGNLFFSWDKILDILYSQNWKC